MKRTACRILLVMLLGVVTSVAVAWGCAVLTDDFAQPKMGPSTGQWHSAVPESWPSSLHLAVSRQPGSSQRVLRGFDTQQRTYTQEIRAYGLPLYALALEIQESPTSSRSRSAITLSRDVRLPLRPVYGGLLANTLLYAGLWWLVVFRKRARQYLTSDRVVWSICIGAILTILVAWLGGNLGSNWSINARPSPAARDFAKNARFNQYSRTGLTRETTSYLTVRVPTGRGPNTPQTREVLFFEMGFPLKCFQGTAERPMRGQVLKTSWLIVVQDSDQWRMKVIPLKPRIGPLLFNTLFFSLLVLPIIELVSRLRGRWRRKRGRCVRCGYDLRGLPGDSEVSDQTSEVSRVCPECGHGDDKVSG